MVYISGYFIKSNRQVNKIYFIFVLPYHNDNIQKTIETLNVNKIYYIYFDYQKKIFLNKEIMPLNNFCIEEANIECSGENFTFMDSLININISKEIINSAVRSYLGKKRLYNNKLINAFEQITKENFYLSIKVIIPKVLKDNIVKLFKREGYFDNDLIVNFLPSANYYGTEIKKIFEITNNMIIFSYKLIFFRN